MSRRVLSTLALALATLVFAYRVREINRLPSIAQLAPRSEHLLYLDSLRTELITFAEQYGKPVFITDTVSPVNGHGRIQMARLREALFDSRIEYGYNDQGFGLDWRSDPRPKPRFNGPVTFEEFDRVMSLANRLTVASAWPQSAAEYAKLRRLFITPQWPQMPQRRANRMRNSPVPPHGEALAIGNNH